MIQPGHGSIFRFTSLDFDAGTGTARLGYAIEDESKAREDLVETIVFPPAVHLDEKRMKAFGRALRLLHLIAGMSYYKAAIPPRIVIEGDPIDRETAGFLRELYLNGLSEFAYRNELDLPFQKPHTIIFHFITY